MARPEPIATKTRGAPMRKINNAVVSWAIVHHVFNREGVLRKSARQLDLANGLPDFFVKHVLNGLHDVGARAAHFPPGVPGEAAKLCRRMVEGAETERVRTSQQLAQALFDAAGQDQRITSGVLVVALFADTEDAQARLRLALIKLDPAGVFRTRERRDDAGQLYLEVEPIADVLPTVRERPQKCAFVDPHPRAPDGLLVLDRQVSGPSADFFLKRFLGAELAYDDEELTRGLIRALTRAENQLRNEGEPGRVVRFKQAVDGLLVMGQIDLNEWLESLDEPAGCIAETEIDALRLDRSFTLDGKTLSGLRKRLRYEGDHGLLVSIDSQFADEVVATPEKDSRTGRWRIVLETMRWERQ